MSSLEGKTAVITGGSRGIGYAIAEMLVANGGLVVLTAREANLAAEAAKRISGSGESAASFACDVRDEDSVRRLFDLVSTKFNTIDFLINNAGIYGPSKNIAETELEGWREALDVNLTGTFLCTKYALPLMKAGSVIVNNLSIAAYQVFPNSAAYIASKQGALGLTNATREDLRGRRIRVMALVAGATDTEIWNQFWPDAPREKMLRPKQVADAVLAALLMPPEASMDEIRISPAIGRL